MQISQALNEGAPAASQQVPRQSLLGMSFDEVEAAVTALGLPRFRARQLWRRIWRHGQTDFGDMTELGKEARAALLSLSCRSSYDHKPSKLNRWHD